MKKTIIIFFLIISGATFAQSNNDQARAYFLQAKSSYESGSYTDAIEQLTKAEKLLGSTNPVILNLKVKAYYNLKQYDNAKTALNQFSKVRSNADSALVDETLSYILKIDEAIAEEKAKEEQIRLAEIKRKEVEKLEVEKEAKEDRIQLDILKAFALKIVNNKTNIRVDEPQCISGDCANGYGVTVLSSGEVYEGNVKNGLRHGLGVNYFAGTNGTIEISNWTNNKQSKYILYKDPNGLWIENIFSENNSSIKLYVYSPDWELLKIQIQSNGKIISKEIIREYTESEEKEWASQHNLKLEMEEQNYIWPKRQEYINNLVNLKYDQLGRVSTVLKVNSNMFWNENVKNAELIPFPVEKPNDVDNFRGFINKSGKLVIDLKEIYPNKKFKYLSIFSEGLAASWVCESDGCLMGFIEMSGKLVIDPIYQSTENFQDGLALVIVNNKVGFIDKTGKLTIPFEYGVRSSNITDKIDGRLVNLCSLNGFYEGLAVVSKDNKYGVINKNGGIVVPFEYGFISPYKNGKAVAFKKYEILKGKKSSPIYINTKGEIID